MVLSNKTKNYLLTTPRLGLRNWQPNDIIPMSEINQDEEVMQFFPGIYTLQKTKEFIQRMQVQLEKNDYCYFATDRLDTGEFIGFIGLAYQNFEMPFCPCTDIGWRLKRTAWGLGFATEGARACLDFAIQKLNLPEIYSIAPAINLPSIKVMEKIGMEYVETFDHPKLLDNEKLKECVVYRKSA